MGENMRLSNLEQRATILNVLLSIARMRGDLATLLAVAQALGVSREFQAEMSENVSFNGKQGENQLDSTIHVQQDAI